MKLITDILPKMPQYGDAEYAADLICPECGKSGFPTIETDVHPTKIIGWAETYNGFQAIFECPYCGQKFRFHCGGDIGDDLDKFDFKLYFWAKRCINWNEIEKELKDGK